MAPRIIGQDLASSRDLLERIAFIKGNYFAKAGLDLAWWDLHATASRACRFTGPSAAGATR